jgi:hypothetical protein
LFDRWKSTNTKTASFIGAEERQILGMIKKGETFFR